MIITPSEDRRAAHMFHLGDQLKKTLDDESCDVILKHANGEVKCHKNIMEAGCEKFKITTETCDLIPGTAINVFNMTWLTVETGRELVSYIYTGSCKITDDNMIGILKTSITWGIDLLTEECYIYMVQNCTTLNACLYYELERKHNHEETHRHFLHYIRAHYNEIRKLAALSDLRVSSLCDVLDNDEINVSNEDELVDSLLELIEEKADAVDEANEPEPRYDVIRFEQISTEHLTDVIRPHPLVSRSPQKDLVLDAIRYKYGKGDITNKRQKRYRCEKLICIDENKSVRAYCREEKKWQEVMKSVSWMNGWSSVQTYRDGLIIVDPARAAYVDVMAGVVQEFPDVPWYMRNAGVACLEQEVYVLGAYGEVNTTWKLVNKEQWKQIPMMIRAVSRPACALHKDTIYVVGGYHSDSKDVQSFNIKTKMWTLKKQLPRSCHRFKSGVIIHADKLTVVTKDQIMSYDDVTDAWDIINYNSITDGCMTAMEHRGQICAYLENERKVMQYDPQHNSWTLLADDVPQLCYVHMMLSVKQYCHS